MGNKYVRKDEESNKFTNTLIGNVDLHFWFETWNLQFSSNIIIIIVV